MRRLTLCLALIVMMGGVSDRLTAVTAAPFTPTTPTTPTVSPPERLSVTSSGGQANQDSYTPAVSANGQIVAFASSADNLVANDTNGAPDIFVHDRITGITSRVSVRSNGAQASGPSFAPAISDDGRIVVFYSLAGNLVDGDTNGKTDVFAHDRQTGQTSLMSVVIGGTANGDSRDPDISNDGRYVVFSSSATNLVGGDTNQKDDIFRWDRVALLMERISVDSNEAQASNHSRTPAVSGDGQRVVFASDAGNLVPGDGNNAPDIFLRDVTAGTTSRVSLTDGGGEANGDNWDPDISRSGQHIVFVSLANNMVPNDNNGYADVFLRNTDTARTRLISIATNNTQANDWCEEPAVSGDGRYVTFQSYATNLIPGTSADVRKVFIRDRNNDTLLLASLNGSGVPGDGSSKEPALAADGRHIVYSSKAANLVPDDTNDKRDIFAYDYIGPPTLSVDHNLGAPGSTFVFTGANWNANETAVVQINGLTLGNVTANGSGGLSFQLITTAGTEQGGYFVTVTQGSEQASAAFMLRAGAPVHPGSGGGFTVPPGIGLTELVFVPVIRR